MKLACDVLTCPAFIPDQDDEMFRMLQARFAVPAFVGLFCAASSATVCAGVVQILNPDAAYIGSTTNLPITGPDFVATPSLTNGAFTMTFSGATPVTRTVPATWSQWSSPPNSESATPRVLSTQSSNSITISFSSPIEIFGIEVEPNFFSGLHDFTANFFDGLDPVGTISRLQLSGSSGARLLAAFATGGDEFTSVTISTDASAGGFGMAQFRFALDAPVADVPEPSVLGLVGAALAALGFTFAPGRRRKSQHIG